ncbi:MAG: hypothetical protein ABH829_04465 [archaeon]
MRAWLRIIEVVMAAILLISFLHLAQSLAFYEPDVNRKLADLNVLSQQVLLTLDSTPIGESYLQEAVRASDYAMLNEKTAEIVPPTYLFAYSTDAVSAKLPAEPDIGHSSYLVSYLSGGEVKTKKVVLYVWRAI